MNKALPLRFILPSPLEGEGPGVRGHSTRRAEFSTANERWREHSTEKRQ